MGALQKRCFAGCAAAWLLFWGAPRAAEAKPGPDPLAKRAILGSAEERWIASKTPGIQIYLRRVLARGTRRGAVLLIHGAGLPGSAAWDLPVKGYSVLQALAAEGFDAYAVDLRGFGRSTQLKALKQPKNANPPVVRAADVMPDLRAAVAHIQKRSKVGRVDLVAWSWGSVVAGMYAGLEPERVRRLLLFGPVYDRRWPSRHQSKGAWYEVSPETFVKYHDPDREALEVLEASRDALFAGLPKGAPIRLPSGPYRDLYGEDAPVWEAGRVCASTLILRGSKDLASRRDAALRLFDQLKNTPSRQYLELGGADHFAFRTYAAPQFQAVLKAFLTAPTMPGDAGCRPKTRRSAP